MKIGKKVAFHNLGCKVNSYETDAMQQLLVDNGYDIVPFEPGADIYIINTCTVTNIADRKSRQMLHKAKKMNPDAVIVAAGCYPQVSLDDVKKDSVVDIIVGNNQKHQIVEMLKEYTGEAKLAAHLDINKQPVSYEDLNISKTAEHTRAYIKIQDGCNQFCSYCLIPFARGRVRSRKPEDVLAEVERLVKNGYKEIVLTGIHVSSYGSDFKKADIEKSGHNEILAPSGRGDSFSVSQSILLELLESLNQIEGLKRIRLSSLEPRIMTEGFVKQLSKLDKICGHFHLSLQSGSQGTLKRMNRHYTPQEYKESCDLLNKYFEHPALATDVIVGFPGETEEEFQESKNFVDEICFYETHIFKYSRRKGTQAAEMENQVSEQIKTKRSSIMLELNKKHKKSFMEYYIGKKLEILIEDEFVYNNEKYQIGLSREYVKVGIKTDKNFSNQLITGRVKCFLTEDILLMEQEA